MAAPQVAGTAAAPQAAPPATPPSAAESGLDAVLGDLTEQELESVDGDADEALEALVGDATPETDPAEPPPERAQRLDDEVIFSDEALKTPAGVAKARARVLELRKMQHTKYLELKQFEKRVAKRHGKLQHQIEKYVTNKRNDDLLLGNVRSNLQGLHSGDPEAILTALGNLTGTDGLKAYELLTSRIVNKGRAPLDPQLQQLLDNQNAQIEQLKQERAAERAQGQVQHLETKVGQAREALQQRVLASTTTPHLTRILQDDPENTMNFIVDQITEAHGRGERLDAAQYFSTLESQLARHFNAGQAPQGDGGGPAPKQPATAQRPPPGQSVGPSRSAPAHAREPSEEESLRALADDPNFLSQFGI